MPYLTARRLLLGIIIVGAALRFWGLYWGFPYALHCDETTLLGVASRMGQRFLATGSLDPQFSVWGALPLYLAWLGTLPARLVGWLIGQRWTAEQLLLLSGRTVSALADTAAIWLVFWLGARRSPLVGVLAAAFYSVALIAVRECHFFSVDSVSCCLALLFVAQCVRLDASPTPSAWLRCGATFGLCISAKIAALPLAALAVAIYVRLAWTAVHEGGDPKPRELVTAARQLTTAAFLAPLLAAIPLAMWHFARARILGLAHVALVQRISQERLRTHSAEFWRAQVESVYTGVSHFLLLGLLMVVAMSAIVLLACHSARGPRTAYELRRRLPDLLAFAAASALVFVILNPYSVLTPADYWLPSGPYSVTWAMLQVAGALHPPPGWTVQFINTIPGWYQLVHVFPYAWGPALTPTLLLALVWAVRSLWRWHRGALWIPALACVLLSVSALGLWMKMTRYVLPPTPLLCVVAGDLAASLIARGGVRRRFAWATIGIVLLISLLWSASYVTSIYGTTDNRVRAAQWLHDHVKPSQTVLLEKDDAWGVGGEIMLASAGHFTLRRYNPLEVMHDKLGQPLTDDDIRRKEAYLRHHMAAADYLIITDNNLRRLARLPRQFPVMNRIYADLLADRTPFRRVATFGDRWHFLGWHVDDRGSEPSFRLFDHPTVIILARARRTP